VLAANAYIDGLHPQIARRIMPVASYIIATEPLGEERARELIRHDEAVADANFVVDYFRLSADHRLLFGGRCSYSGWHPKNLAGYMRPRMLRHAQGYSGQGVALAGMMGRLIAGDILGTDDRFELFTRIPHMPFPGGILARPAHTLGMLYYRLKDLIG